MPSDAPHPNATPPRGAPIPPRTVVLSGATGNLGPVVAERFAAEGCTLVLPVYDRADEVRTAFPDAYVLEADLLDADDAARVADRARAEVGPVDTVLNVAGGFAAGSALELTPNALRAQLDINLVTAATLSTAFLPDLVEAGRGHVVGVSAGAARGTAKLPAYAASKAALEAYLRSVAAEVGPHGVDVATLVVEGTLDTPANREAMPDADRSAWIAPLAVADGLWFLATRSAGGRVAELRVGA